MSRKGCGHIVHLNLTDLNLPVTQSAA